MTLNDTTKVRLIEATSLVELVNINVGGTLFTTTYDKLKQVPDTRLATINKNSKEFVQEKDFYFFDRNPDIFTCVLDYYRTGELHLPKQVCGAAIRNELEFWQIPSTSISDCCVSAFFKFEDELEVNKNLRQQFEAPTIEYSPAQLGRSKWNRVKHNIWTVLDKPNSSAVARVYSVIYMMIVLLTCVLFMLSTHTYFREPIDDVIKMNATYNMTVREYLSMQYSNPKIVFIGSTRDLIAIEILNYVCTLFFAGELLVRVFTCPAKREMLKNWHNWVDVIIVLALIVTFALNVKKDFYTSRSLMYTYIVARGFIILRLLRLFRFSRHFTGLKVVYLSLRASVKELGLLCLTFFIMTSLFGGLIYYAEFTEDGQFDNVLVGIWWATVTLTTIGYGDYVPTVPVGYILGGVCGMCGLLLLSMPIAIIATNFNDYYSQNKVREKQFMRKRQIMITLKNIFKPRHTAPLVITEGDGNGSTSNGHMQCRSPAIRRFKQIAVKAARAEDSVT